MVGNDLADLQVSPTRVPVEVDTPGTGEVDDYPFDSRDGCSTSIRKRGLRDRVVWVPYIDLPAL